MRVRFFAGGRFRAFAYVVLVHNALFALFCLEIILRADIIGIFIRCDGFFGRLFVT